MLINFIVVDEENYWKFLAEKTYLYYSYPSRFSISKLNLDWGFSSEGMIYFIWDNSFSSITPKTIRAYITIEE
jgi:hypothetical protein